MNSKTRMTIVEGAVMAVLGIMIAIFGGQTVLDSYFGALFVLLGACLFVIEILFITKNKYAHFSDLFLSSFLIIVGCFLLANQFSFDYVITLLVYAVIAFGAALLINGLVSSLTKRMALGMGQLFIGVSAITLGVLYLTVNEFRSAFWIVVGVLVSVYGIFTILTVFIRKKGRRR